MPPSETLLFHAEVPKSLQRAILRALIDGWFRARGIARMFRRERLKDAASLRRVFVEEALGDILVDTERHRVSYRQSTSCTNWVLESDRIVMTAVSRSQPVDVLPEAPYRQTLARTGQLDLFLPESDSNFLPEEKRLYAVLLYGGRPGADFPSFVRVVFPSADGVLLPQYVDLLEEHVDLVAQFEHHRPYVELSVPAEPPPTQPVEATEEDAAAAELEGKLVLRFRPPELDEG